MTPLLHRVAEVFRNYAHSVGWGPDDYRLYVRPNTDWGKIRVVLAARRFPAGGDPWFSVMHFLEEELWDDPDLRDSLGLTVSTFDQMKAGGIHGLGEGYEEIAPISSDPAA